MKKWLFFIPVIFLSLSFVNGDSSPCADGYEMNWNIGDCQDLNECSDLDACPAGYECQNTLGGYRCYGPDGTGFICGEGPSGFDPTKYNINMCEKWGFHKIEVDISVGVWVALPNGKSVKLSVGAIGKTEIRYPFCEESQKNLCIKTHIDKPIQYV